MRILLTLVIWLGCWGGMHAQAQTLKPGDTISIQVFQDPKLDRQALIGPTGMISFPLIGEIQASGQSPSGLASLLRSRLQSQYRDPLDITVSLVALAPTTAREAEQIGPRFYVTGQVKTPGPQQIKTRITLLQGIALAGGLDIFAAKRRIQVRRQMGGQESVFYFDYVAFEEGRDLTGNINLLPNDVIIVPERGLFEFQ